MNSLEQKSVDTKGINNMAGKQNRGERTISAGYRQEESDKLTVEQKIARAEEKESNGVSCKKELEKLYFKLSGKTKTVPKVVEEVEVVYSAPKPKRKAKEIRRSNKRSKK